MSTAYTELLQDIANQLNLSQSVFVDTQELVLDDLKIGFDFQPLDPNMPSVGDVVFFSVLGRPAPEREAQVHRLLLQGNNLWAGTGGATLGIQQEGGAVVFAMRLPLEGLNAEHLLEVLGDYADIARYWVAVVAGATSAPTLAAVEQRA
jgi:hypothetical protein